MISVKLTCIECKREVEILNPVTTGITSRKIEIILPAEWWMVHDGVSGSWKMFCPAHSAELPPEVKNKEGVPQGHAIYSAQGQPQVVETKKPIRKEETC